MRDTRRTATDWRRSPGFTLLEALIALALLGAIAVSVASTMLLAMETTSASGELTELTLAATEQLESLYALPFDADELRAGGSTQSSQRGYSVDLVVAGMPSYLRWEVQDESSLLKRLRLVAGRARRIGPPREITLEAYRVAMQ